MASEVQESSGMGGDLFKKFYLPAPEDVPPATRKLLEKYSKIPPKDVLSHVLEVRDQAWKVFPYPCIGQFKFLDLSISRNPNYTEVLDRLKAGQKLLDLGCCVGQEIRQLAHDGAPSGNLYGCDLHDQFMNIGYDLFNDKATLNATFLAADIFNENSKLKDLEGKIDIIWASSFLHLFSWDGDIQAIKRMIKLLNPKPGCLVLGKQIGNVNAGEIAYKGALQKTMYMHDERSFRKMWEQAGEETGTKWDVDVKSRNLPIDGAPEGTLGLAFSARRF